MMETIIRFPDVGGLANEVDGRLPYDLDVGLSNLGEAFSRLEIQREAPATLHVTIEMRHWLNAFQDVLLEARTALVMWICYTELLAGVPHDQDHFEEKVLLDRARNYFANDASIRLATGMEHLAQLLNRVYNLGFREKDHLVKGVLDRLTGKCAGVFYADLWVVDSCRIVREQLRNAFAHRSNPVIPRSQWEEVHGEDGPLMYLGGKADVRPSMALETCKDAFQALSAMGSRILTAVADDVPELVAAEVRQRTGV